MSLNCLSQKWGPVHARFVVTFQSWIARNLRGGTHGGSGDLASPFRKSVRHVEYLIRMPAEEQTIVAKTPLSNVQLKAFGLQIKDRRVDQQQLECC